MINILQMEDHTKFNFPAGELHVKLNGFLSYIKETDKHHVDIKFKFEKNEDLVELMLVYNALKHKNIYINVLLIDYFPFSRQDRVANSGECFSLEVFTDIIKYINPKFITITDPHSDVIAALLKDFNLTIIEQHQIFQDFVSQFKNYYLISPDGGALKKIYKLGKVVRGCKGIIEYSKQRNVETGEITGTKSTIDKLDGEDCFIVDDICDGGRTFIEIAKDLRTKNCGKIYLCVTHGLFTKGINVFDGIIDVLVTKDGPIYNCSDDVI